jgi:hypothetical protein
MLAVPVSLQLREPMLQGIILLYLIIAAVPLCWLGRCGRRRAALAVALALACAGVGVWHFKSTPPGVHQDGLVTLFMLSPADHWMWRGLFGESRAVTAQGWNAVPWYLVYRFTDSLLAERIAGLAWQLLLVIAAATAPGLNLSAGLICGAFMAATPWVLWQARNPTGTDLLLQQMLLIVGLLWLRRPHKRWWIATIPVGALLALLQYTYAAAHVTVVYPLLLLWGRGRWRACAAVYLVAMIGIIPLTYTWEARLLGEGVYDPRAFDLPWILAKAGRVYGSLIWREYSLPGTWAFQGAQTLSWAALIAITAGGVACLRTDHGRVFIVLAVLGALPCVASTARGGNSHRMIMMVIPLAMIAAAAPDLVPERRPRIRAATAGLIVVAIIASGVHTWTSDAFWSGARALQIQQWNIPFHDAVASELYHAPLGTRIRVWPGEDAARLVTLEHGWPLTTLDLHAADFAERGALVIVWRGLPPRARERLSHADPSLVTVEDVTGFVTITRFPRGAVGLLDSDSTGIRQ